MMVLIKLFTGQHRDADLENRNVDTLGKVRVGQIERVALKHLHCHM